MGIKELSCLFREYSSVIMTLLPWFRMSCLSLRQRWVGEGFTLMGYSRINETWKKWHCNICVIDIITWEENF